MPSNSASISSYGFCSTCARTFSRPRWAIPKHQFVGLERRGLLHERVEQRNEGLAAFERESLLAHVLGVEELFERLGPDEPREDVGALVVGHGRPVARRLHPLLKPRPRRLVGDVHVLDPERAAVRFLEGGHELAQRRPLETLERRGVHRAAEVSLREAELAEGEQGMRVRGARERIEIGREVPEFAVGVD